MYLFAAFCFLIGFGVCDLRSVFSYVCWVLAVMSLAVATLIWTVVDQEWRGFMDDNDLDEDEEGGGSVDSFDDLPL